MLAIAAGAQDQEVPALVALRTGAMDPGTCQMLND